MLKHTCHICGAPFYSDTAAWGDDTCGDCIAASIEVSLRGGFEKMERKPARRTGDAPADWPAQGEELPRRRA